MINTSVQAEQQPIVKLVNCMGNDLSVVNAARTSYATSHSGLTTADIGLISYLMRERHGTPFEMVQFQFMIECPLRVAREWQRHRIGSFNEMSTRYVVVEPRFFVPEPADIRVQTGSRGHYVMEPAPQDIIDSTQMLMQTAYEHAWAFYRTLLDSGVAKELAAYVLPMGLYTKFVWSVNLRSLFNFISLRNADNALREIRQAAIQVESYMPNLVPHSYQAFLECGRKAP